MIEICVYHKPFIMKEELVGRCLIRLHNVPSCKHTDWFILNNEKDEVVGSILICFTVEEDVENQPETQTPAASAHQPQARGNVTENSVI